MNSLIFLNKINIYYFLEFEKNEIYGDQLLSDQPVGDLLFCDPLLCVELKNFEIIGDQHFGYLRLSDHLNY